MLALGSVAGANEKSAILSNDASISAVSNWVCYANYYVIRKLSKEPDAVHEKLSRHTFVLFLLFVTCAVCSFRK
jgi:hypothetical protein